MGDLHARCSCVHEDLEERAAGYRYLNLLITGTVYVGVLVHPTRPYSSACSSDSLKESFLKAIQYSCTLYLLYSVHD